MDAILKKVPAGRKDLGVEKLLVALVSSDLAEIGRFPAADQSFEQLAIFRAANVDLHIPTAGGTAFVITGPAGGFGAWIGHFRYREGALVGLGQWDVPGLQPPFVHQAKVVASQLARLPIVWNSLQITLEVMSSATHGAVLVFVLLEVPARHMNPCGNPKLIVVLEWLAKF